MALLTLKRYQQQSLEQLDKYLRAARLSGPRSAFEAQTGYGYNAEPFGETPCVCLRIPTGGGKTLMASEAVGRMAREWPTDLAKPLVLWLVPLYAVVVAFGLGLGLLLGVLNVFIRDVGQMTPIVLQFWFWFTPIIYMTSILPPGAQSWMRLNPMLYVVEGFQAVLVFKTTPALGGLAVVAGLALGLMGLALACLRAAGQEMADVL